MLIVSNIDGENIWFQYYKEPSEEARAALLLSRLDDALAVYPNTKFDHMKVGHLGRRVCVFVVKGHQSVVVYDKTREFPSANLIASLVLLGS